ncbi:MAG: phosphoribosylanthranilate isomerase [Gammaproteobacteria bacterium]|nr:phosphoribosylanthranilate isomerase [Gammaproteobacteria bacterium]
MTTRIKICGITCPEDAQHAAALGADAVGLVFYGPSPRNVDIKQACAVMNVLPPFVTSVGLFVNATMGEIQGVLDQVNLDLLQFHGDESPEFCTRFSRPYIKAIRMRENVDLQVEADQYAQAQGLLLDAYHPALPGGTGESFEWTRVPDDLPMPVILAGGLNADNVGEAIRTVQPYAVDVSGGVEAEKGIKDWGKMADFVAGVRVAK